MEYPLLLWLVLHALCLFFTSPTLLMGVFLFLGVLSAVYSIGIGAGDFLFLATFFKKKKTGFLLFPVFF